MKNVDVTFNWRMDKDDTQQSATITLDLSALSDADFAEYAYSDIIVQAQGKMRAWLKTDQSKPAPWKNGGVYVVKPKGTKVLADPTKKLAAAAKLFKQLGLDKMTPEELADYLENLG